MDEFEIFEIEKTAYSGDHDHLRAIAFLNDLHPSYLGGSQIFLKVRGSRASIEAFRASVMPKEYDPRQQPYTKTDL